MTATIERPTTKRASVPPSRFRPADVIGVATDGLTHRKVRTVLSAVGITIGIAAMVAVLGLSESSRADLSNQIEELGTNLLTVEATTGLGAGDASLPDDAAAKLGVIGPVEVVADVVTLDELPLRNDVMSDNETKGLSAVAADTDLLDTLRAEVAVGRWLDDTTSSVPTVVLGSVAAERLAIDDVDDGAMITIGDEWFTVIGILDEFPLSENLDRSVFIGRDVAADVFESELNPSVIYVRTDPESVDDVRAVAAATADPQSPDEVSISRPTDALEAQEAADSAFTSLFLGLGAVALLVGGIGIANVMVIAVIERRNEIGLRRALGATRAHIRRQFLVEALLLSSLGGASGVGLGAAVTALYADIEGWEVVIPPIALIGGFAAAVAIGALAGLYPAMRAARLAPTEALRS